MPHFSFGIVLLDYFTAGVANELLDVSSTFAMVCLIVSIPVYIGLYMYLDAVIPNEFGIAKTCCFCLRKRHLEAPDEAVNDSEPAA